jgi:predicted component of type VI protein secretion system
MDGTSMFLLVLRRELDPQLIDLRLRPRVTIGRGRDCDIVLDDPKVSRRHVAVERALDRYFLVDLGSSNGTFVNGFKVTLRGQIALQERDSIEVGDTRLVFGSSDVLSAVRESSSTGSSVLAVGFEDLIMEARRDDTPNGVGETTVILRAFSNVPRVVGFERSLEVLAPRLGASFAAVYLREEKGVLQLAASWPTAGSSLASIAERAWRTHAGVAMRHHMIPEASPAAADTTPTQHVAAAVPFDIGCGPVGVLAIERATRGFDRRDLARLALFGDRLAHALVTRSPNDDEDARASFEIEAFRGANEPRSDGR